MPARNPAKSLFRTDTVRIHQVVIHIVLRKFAFVLLILRATLSTVDEIASILLAGITDLKKFFFSLAQISHLSLFQQACLFFFQSDITVMKENAASLTHVMTRPLAEYMSFSVAHISERISSKFYPLQK